MYSEIIGRMARNSNEGTCYAVNLYFYPLYYGV
jgi:hypothetical protein